MFGPKWKEKLWVPAKVGSYFNPVLIFHAQLPSYLLSLWTILWYCTFWRCSSKARKIGGKLRLLREGVKKEKRIIFCQADQNKICKLATVSYKEHLQGWYFLRSSQQDCLVWMENHDQQKFVGNSTQLKVSYFKNSEHQKSSEDLPVSLFLCWVHVCTTMPPWQTQKVFEIYQILPTCFCFAPLRSDVHFPIFCKASTVL